MIIDRISSKKMRGDTGNSFAAIEINGDGVVVRNAVDERDSTGNIVLAGSDEVLSARRTTGTTINASYIKSGVIDANLLRAGLIQTVPSWNTKWYGAPNDHAAVQIGFTGGSIAATAVSTGSGTVSLTLPSGHGFVTGDYVRVSGLYFTTGTLLGGVGLNLPTNGPVNYASATVATNTLTYSKSDITSGLTAAAASTVYVGKANAVSSVVRTYDDPSNPAELSTVVVTTSAAHGFAVGDYVELANVAETIDGVAYVTAVTSTTFTFKQRFGDDISLDFSESDFVLPSILAPVAIKVIEAYTQNSDGSIFARNITLGGSSSVTGADSANTTNSRIALDSSPAQTGVSIIAYPVTQSTTPVAGTATKSGTTITVTKNNHGLVVGAYISTFSSNLNLVVGTARIKTVTTNTFTITKPNNLTTVSPAAAIYYRKYSNIQYYAGGIHQFYGETLTGTTGASTGSPGAVLAGSLALGAATEASTYGTSGLDVLADGELGFLSATTAPVFIGGGNLYSRTGSSDISTSGDFMLGTSATSTQGDIRFKAGAGGRIGAFSDTSSNTSIGVYNSDRSQFTPIVASGFYPGQGSSYLGWDGSKFTMNDSLAITGAITSLTTLTASGILKTTSTSAGAIDIQQGGIYAQVGTGNGLSWFSGGVFQGKYAYSVTAGQGHYFSGIEAVGTVAAYWSVSSTAAYLGRTSSSIRYKENINAVDFNMEDIVSLSPVLFTVKDEYRQKDDDGNPVPATVNLGIIAEHGDGNPAWEKLVVRSADTGEIDSWAYQHMGVVLLSAVRQLYQKTKDLESRIAELEAGA